MLKKLLLSFVAITTLSFSISAKNININTEVNDANAIKLGTLEKVDSGIYKLPVTLAGSLKTYSIKTTNAKFKLTSVSGTGYKFIDANNGSTTDSTPSTNKDYVSVTLQVSAASDSLNSTAKTALETIRYNSITKDSSIALNADTALLYSGDYYYNGHYYTISSNDKSWKGAMEWAYNLQTTDTNRKYSYSGYISYPVIIETTDESTFVSSKLTSSNTKRFYLPAIPVKCNAGSITVSGDVGNKTVTVEGQPKVSADLTGIYGHGEYWKWLGKKDNVKSDTTTDSSGASLLPNESDKVTKTVSGTIWPYDNPTNGGMVYIAHPSLPGYWDDLSIDGTYGNNIWTETLTGQQFAGKMYGLAEWESDGNTTASATWSTSEKTITYMNGDTQYSTEKYVEQIGKESLIEGPSAPTGKEFIGWFDNSSGGNKVTSISKDARGDITLYARFVSSTISFKANSIGGYRKEDDNKIQIVSFGFTIEQYSELDTGDSVGIYVYSDSGSTKVKEFSTTSVSQVKDKEGRFYCIYDCASNNATYYAKAYAVISGSTYYSELISATGSFDTEYTV